MSEREKRTRTYFVLGGMARNGARSLSTAGSPPRTTASQNVSRANGTKERTHASSSERQRLKRHRRPRRL